MAGEAGTLERLALLLGQMLAPLERQLASGQVLVLLQELGMSLPEELLAEPGFTEALSQGTAAAAQLPDQITRLVTAIENEQLSDVLSASVTIIEDAARVISSFDTIADELQAAGGSLPGVDPAVLGTFASELPVRLLQHIVLTYLEVYHPVLSSTAALLGLVERVQEPGTAGDPTRPAFTRRSLRLDRVGDLLQDPAELARTLYGWGDPGFDGQALLVRLQALLSAAGLAAAIEPATATEPLRLHFLLLEVGADRTLSPPGLKATLRIPIAGGLTLTVPLSLPGWSVVIEADAMLEADLSATVTPPATVALLPPGGSLTGKLTLGFRAEPVAPATEVTLLGDRKSVV